MVFVFQFFVDIGIHFNAVEKEILAIVVIREARPSSLLPVHRHYFINIADRPAGCQHDIAGNIAAGRFVRPIRIGIPGKILSPEHKGRRGNEAKLVFADQVVDRKFLLGKCIHQVRRRRIVVENHLRIMETS
ncbi:hypothetical protein D3C87_1528750 [compost metagenome]